METLLVSAAGLGLASLLGSAIGMCFRTIPHRLNDMLMGFCAGMMLAASLVGLIIPSLDMAGGAGWWQVVLGVAGGVALIAVLDHFTPHLHHLSGIEPERHRGNSSVNRVMLFVLAIAIHKFPEGLATGVVFDDGNPGNALAVALTIAVQNIPEGMVVVSPLVLIGVSRLRVIAISLAIAALEVGGVFVGWALGDLSSVMLPALTALAGGAMLYVISDEMIPETHAHGYEKPATIALVTGVIVMLFIDRLTV